MSPKYRGGKEEWLDDHRSLKGRRPRRSIAPRSKALAPEEANATVCEVFPKQCRVIIDAEGGGPLLSSQEQLCAYRKASLLGSEGPDQSRERSPVAVGDRVRVDLQNKVITGVCARTNLLARPAPDREGLIHVLVANLEALVIVAAARNPDFSPGLVDRFLVAAAAQGIPTLLCINKIDLLGDEPGNWRSYRAAGIEIHELSAKRAMGIENLRQRLLGKRVAFCGHSGVGKTSLLRALLGSEIGKIGDVSEVTGKGKHTTSSAILLSESKELGGWVDTPGVREFGLFGIEAEDLLDYYPDLQALGCAQEGCRHVGEESCAAGDQPRYASYRRIYDSLVAGEA